MKKKPFAIQIYHRFAGPGNPWIPYGFTWVDDSRKKCLSRVEVWMRDNLNEEKKPVTRIDKYWEKEYTAFWVSAPKKGRQASPVFNYCGKSRT